MTDDVEGTTKATDPQWQSVREAAKRLLRKLGIHQVVVVDDEAIPGPEAFLAAYSRTRSKAPLPPERAAWEQANSLHYGQNFLRFQCPFY